MKLRYKTPLPGGLDSEWLVYDADALPALQLENNRAGACKNTGASDGSRYHVPPQSAGATTGKTGRCHLRPAPASPPQNEGASKNARHIFQAPYCL